MQKKDTLRDKLEVFIRKYYQNRLIKGLMYGVGLGLSYFFVVAVAEYFGHFPPSVRLGLFIFLLAGLTGILGYYILYPLAKLLHIGRRISYDKAAKLIGKHFPEIDDKILNTLQLQKASAGERALIEASIDQRVSQLVPVPFQRAVNFRENRKYWPILVVPVLIFALVGISGWWDDFSESGRRIAAYDREFLPEAPFQFLMNTESLKVEQGEDVKIELGFEGNSLPADASMVMQGGAFRMAKDGQGNYRYQLDNVQESMDFRFSAAGFFSQVYHLEVIPVPQVSAFTLRVSPPGYTAIKAFETEAKLVQDIPEGSSVEWALDVKQADRAYLFLDSNEMKFRKLSGSQYSVNRVVTRDLTYSVVTENKAVRKENISGNRLKVIRDQYPHIRANFTQDSTTTGLLYYNGSISDDYGFQDLSVVMELKDKKLRKNVAIDRSALTQRIGAFLLLDSLAGEESKEVRIYLEVRDNDGVNGPKARRSEAFVLNLLGTEEKKQKLDEEYQKFFNSSRDNQKAQEEMEKSLAQMQKELMEKKSLGWKEKKKIEDLLKKQQNLLEKQQQNKEKLEELQKEEGKLKQKPEDIKKKEEEISKVNEEQKELEELMEEIERLMKDLNTEKLREKLQELQQKNQQNRQAEERQEDLLKDLKFQKDILEQAQKLEDLSKKMEELAKKEEKSGLSKEEIKEEAAKESQEQKKVEEEFKKVEEKIDELRKEDAKFDKAAEKENLDEEKSEASDEMQKAQEKLSKQENQPANQNQKKASDKMQEMSESLQMSMMQMQAQANEENIQTLRQILENLETLSFDIEALSDRSKEVNKNDPAFKQLLSEQKRLQDGAKIIEDSLVALSKRVPQLEQVVFRELEQVKDNLKKGIENLEELQNARAASNQQYVMTAANNLALLLDESLQQMQQMQAQMKKGNQNCQKPGGGSPKPSMANLKKMQGELGKKMDEMKQGQKKDGKGKAKGEGRNGKEIVEMLSRQEQIRRGLEKLMNEAGGQGDKGNMQKAVEEMKELERDLLNGELNDNYKKRLAEIETRLLESEKAELEQKKDEKRESETENEIKQIYKQELEKYLKEKQSERESIDRLPLNFRSYYKEQTSKYLDLR